MIDELKVFNLPSGVNLTLPKSGDVFVLNTCQRSLAIGFNLVPGNQLPQIPLNTKIHIGTDAYTFLLETICGLHSKIQGENEIVDQFKSAFDQFLLLPKRSTYLIKMMEKLLKDAKEIRSFYLKGLGQQSYAGVARKLILSKVSFGDILILGSGQLAKDCTKLLNRKFNVFLSARNQSKIASIQEELSHMELGQIDFNDHEQYSKFPVIINTIGVKNLTLFNHSFFTKWNKVSPELFIDLGSPSVISTSYGIDENVFRLDDIFSLGESLNTEKQKKVSEARNAMVHLVEKRKSSFSLHFPYAWEDMQFA